MSTGKAFNYHGFVLCPTFRGDTLVEVNCYELDFCKKGNNYDAMVREFKKTVDEVLANKNISYQDAEKEVNRLKTLLKEQPEVFYRTRQVYDLLTLAEDLLAASKKEQEVDFNMKEYYKQLDRLAALDHKTKFQPLELRREIIEIHNLFSGVLKFSLDEVKQHYFERANKE